jgi:hypothetical protein
MHIKDEIDKCLHVYAWIAKRTYEGGRLVAAHLRTNSFLFFILFHSLGASIPEDVQIA